MLNKKFLMEDVRTEIQFIFQDFISFGDKATAIRRFNVLKLKYLNKLPFASSIEKKALMDCVARIDSAKRKFIGLKRARLL